MNLIFRVGPSTFGQEIDELCSVLEKRLQKPEKKQEKEAANN